MYKEVKIFLEILKFVKNYQRFLSKIVPPTESQVSSHRG